MLSHIAIDGRSLLHYFLYDLNRLIESEFGIVVSGNPGIGKSTFFQKFAYENPGVFYYELRSTEKVDNIANKLFRGRKYNMISYIPSYIYTLRDFKFDDIGNFVDQNKQFFIEKFKRKPIFIFDNLDSILSAPDNKESVSKLFEFVQKGISSESYVTILITNTDKYKAAFDSLEYSEILADLRFTKD